ncbi:MAG TPA: AI-2E family transporter [Anaerolineales bacterium]|nr:AI-2E family transporter [Anaerolineales bacterium]
MDRTDTQTKKSRFSELPYPKLWWLVTTAIAAALVLGLGTLELIRLVALPLAVLIFALTLAAALEPVVSWLERRMPRLPAMLLTYFALLILLAGLVLAVIPSLIAQVQDFSSVLPMLSERARGLLNRLGGFGDALTNAVSSQASGMGSALLRVPLNIASAFSLFVLILFVSFYILSEASQMQRFTLSLFPEERRPAMQELLTSMGQAMGGYLRGVVINGVIVGLVTFFGLLIIGVDFALVFGALAGLLELVPIAGPIIATLIIVGLTFLESPGLGLTVLIFMVVLQQIENNILVPYIMRSQTEISPLLSLMAIFVGGVIGGLFGALIAIPVAAALRVLVREVLAPAIRRQTGVEGDEREAE